jgi:hypothetical protein
MTFYLAAQTIIGADNGFGATNEYLMGPGRFELNGVYYTCVSTNGNRYLPSSLSASSVVSVDAVGSWRAIPGPSIARVAAYGFSVALVSVGFFLVVRRFFTALLPKGPGGLE